MVRRTIAIAGGVILLILLVLLFRGCLDARKERAIEDYAGSSSELLQRSDTEGTRTFEVLSAPRDPDQDVDRQNQINAQRADAATLVEQAQDLDVPDEVAEAHDYLLEALELRRDALAEVADRLPGALATEERRQSTDRIAQMMQVFLASDVLLNARWHPAMQQALTDEELLGQVNLPRRGEPLRFVDEIEWVDPSYVADQIAGIRGTGGDAATPGLHGNGLGTVALGGITLTPGAGATVQLTDDIAFDIQVVNQGDSTETDVAVLVSVGQGDDVIELEETLPEIAPGEAQQVTIPLAEQPPVGQNVPISVLVEPVPGEETTDNNEAEFTVIFTR